MKTFPIKQVLLGAALLATMASCKKTFEQKPQTELDATLAYRNVNDADAAVVGIYGKFMGLADRYIVLNELRGDLMQYTNNADEYLRQLSNHTVTADNPYASPRPFYELIINCNDVLKNFTIMRQKNALKETEYNQRYSDVACLRSFLYLQLGIHFGEVPYVTDPLEDVTAINDASKFPKLAFNVLLDSLINFTERIPYKDQYPTGTSLNISVDGYQLQKMFINKKCLLGDLNLWKGNYVQAATYYRQVMEVATVGTAGENYYSQYKLGWAGDFNHYISYGRAGDASTLTTTDGWRLIFDRAQDNGFNREWIWAMPYDSKFSPENPLIKLFSPIGGNYLVKPSQSIIENWDNQVQRPVNIASTVNGLPYDARGPLTWRNIGGQPVIMKFLYRYISHLTNLPANPLQKNGYWFLYRQTHMHLRFAEAANRAGRYKLAFGLLNGGIAAAFAPPTQTPAITDMTLWQNTLSETAPFNFDARNSGSSGVPYFRADWYRNIGIRARANLTDIAVTASDSLLRIEDGLINEGALENSFEGSRWPDLLRIALRRNDPAFIADKVYNKMLKDGVPGADAARAKLMNKANWYLPFKL